MIPLLFLKAKYCPSHSFAVQCALLNGRERVTLPARNAGSPEFVQGSNGRERAPLPAGTAGSPELVQGSGVTRLGVSEDDRRCHFCLTIDLAAAFQLSMEMQVLVERKG